MAEYIDREAAMSDIYCEGVSCQDCPFLIHSINGGCRIADYIRAIPSADVVPVVRCKDCVHQTKFWHNDGRMKSGGYYICGCDLADEYSHVCLDDDFCSQGERMDGEEDESR